MISNPPEPQSVHEAIAILEEFFSLVDSDAIFRSMDPSFHGTTRGRLREALTSLLVWGRPALEVARELMWPYEGLRGRHEYFEEAANRGAGLFVRGQARKYLGLLPFPCQWSWMLKLENEDGGDQEVRNLLSLEEAEIASKIDAKPQRHYKLHHFCQILKRPSTNREKGVLRIFSLPYLFTRHNLLQRLNRRYVIFAEPPMGIVFRHAWWRHFGGLEEPCVMGVASMEDILFLRGQRNIEPVQLAHGDFLEEMENGAHDGGHDKYDEHGGPEGPKEYGQYDIVFNATYDDMPRKRHELMLQLLQHPLLLGTRALFLGRGSGDNVEKLKRRVAGLGLGARVTVLANLRRSDVPPLLDRCRMGVHLSLYENACRGVYEFFRSDLPCVASSSMGGMNLDIFNEKTGMAVVDSDLPGAIAFILGNKEMYEPRKWLLANSGSRNSSWKLNGILRELFGIWGYEWHEDIVPLGSSGASRYIDAPSRERFKEDFQWILECFRTSADPLLTFSID